MWRRALAAGVGVVGAVILFVAGGRLMLEGLERQLIYFPTRMRADAPPPAIPDATVEEVELQSEDGVPLHGLLIEGPTRRADLLFFHGNAGNLYDRLDNVAELVGRGFRVLIIDYRGYGKSGGRPSEEGLYRDATAAYRYLTEGRGIAPARLVVFGRSLGSAVAIDLATREPVGVLIVESAFTSARDMARLHYSWLPSVVLGAMSHEFDSLEKASRLRAPVLYVHGARDAIVPMEMGRRLYEASPEPKAWHAIPDAGHNDTWVMGGPTYYGTITEFVERHLSSDR